MKHTYLLLMVMLLAAAPAKAQKTPLEFNNNLSSITDSLFARGQAWGAKFGEASKSGNYISLKPLSTEMLVYINRQTIYLQNMKDVKNSKPMRMAMLDLLIFEKKMVTEAFVPFESFTAATPADKVQAALDDLKTKSIPENAIIKKIADAQDVYAAENGFKIEGGN